MKKTLVIGAGGQIGRLLVQQLADRQQPVVAMVRDRRQVSFPPSVEVVEADLEGDFSHAFLGCTRVVFTAGSGAKTGPDKTLLVDLWGAKRAVDIAREQGVEQFVMVSARNAGDPDNGPEAIKPYLVAKHFADEYLISSSVPYTVLRPGRLTDEPATGRITTQRPDDAAQQVITRADSADIIVQSLGNDQALGKVVELYQSEQESSESLFT